MIKYLDNCCEHGTWLTNRTYVVMLHPDNVPSMPKREATAIRKLLLSAGWGNRGRIDPLAIRQRALMFLYD